MSRGTKIAILIVAGIIVIGLIVYFIIWPVFTANRPAANANANANLPAAGSLPAANANQPAPVANVPPPSEASIETKTAGAARTIAVTFAERLATYDNRHGLANLDDLESISTAAVWKYIDGQYRDDLLKSLPSPQEYYAVASTMVKTDLLPVDEATVNAAVQLQRLEQGSSAGMSYRTLDLVLKKVNGVWLVARVDWEK